MATMDKTTFWSFTTRITSLATNTTLGTATRHDFAAITIDIPELTRTIKSVKLRITCRDAFTAATDIDGWRIGIKLGATAFDDVDYTSAAANTGDHETLIVERDVTAYFVANFGSGASQTCQVGVAFQTGSASNVTGITAELFITYAYDNSAATQCKSVEIVLQGHHTVIAATGSDLEFGTTGGTSNAPANQIPDLSTFCPENSKSFKQVYWRFTAITNDNSTTDTTLGVKLDSGTLDSRFVVEQALQTATPYRDIVDALAAPHSMTTNAVHALKVQTDVANTFENISVVMVVTYTFTVSGTTREIHSVRVPFECESANPGAIGAASGDDERYSLYLDIQEPGIITMLQSGLVIYDQMMGVNGVTTAIFNKGQAARTYAHANVTRSGPHVYTRRCDFDNSDWFLIRGDNRLTFDARVSSVGAGNHLSGYAVINYTADVAPEGIGVGNRTVAYSLISHPSPTTSAIIFTEERLPSFTGTLNNPPWLISGVFSDIGLRALTSTISANWQAERQQFEESGDGWFAVPIMGGNSAELGRREIIVPLTFLVRRDSRSLNRMDVTLSRRWRYAVGASVTNVEICGTTWLTFHQMTFLLSGTVKIGSTAAPNGKTVQIYAYDSAGNVAALYETITFNDDGSFELQVSRNTLDYRANYQDGTNVGSSLVGKPTPAPLDPPVFIGYGAEVSAASGSISPSGYPNSLKEGDVELLIIESDNTAQGFDSGINGGFVEIPDSPQGISDTRLTAYWRRLDYPISNPLIDDLGDHRIARILRFKGCIPTGDPWDVTAGDTASTSTSVTVPGDTTTVDKCLIVAIASNATDSLTPQTSGWINTNLVGLRELVDGNTNLGNGGGFGVAAGVKETAGAYGNTTATLADTSEQARISIALKPQTSYVTALDIQAGGIVPAAIGSALIR